MRPTIIFETHLSRYSREHDMTGCSDRAFCLRLWGAPCRVLLAGRDQAGRIPRLQGSRTHPDRRCRAGHLREHFTTKTLSNASARPAAYVPWSWRRSTDPARPMPAELLAAERFGWQSRTCGICRHSPQATRKPSSPCHTPRICRTNSRAWRRRPGRAEGILRHHQGPRLCCAIVDHCRSSPIFYSERCRVERRASAAHQQGTEHPRTRTGSPMPPWPDLSPVARRLFQGLHQLEAGSLAHLDSDATVPAVTRYRAYMPGPIDHRSEDVLSRNSSMFWMARSRAPSHRLRVGRSGCPERRAGFPHPARQVRGAGLRQSVRLHLWPQGK